MYAKCGSLEDGWSVFNKMPSQNVVTWSIMILGHVKCGQAQKELGLFQHMQQEGVQPDSDTFVGVLTACPSMVAIEEGRCVHRDIIKSRLESDVFVGSSLVNMYAKCGSMEDAWRVFNKMPSRTVVTVNAILGGCAMNGHGREALKYFEQMFAEGVQPDNTTFICLLSACQYACLVDEGMHCYTSVVTGCMISAVGILYLHGQPCWSCTGDREYDHGNALETPCGCMDDFTCRIHGAVKMAECVVRRVLEMESDNAAGYGVSSNISAAAGN
jgi:pentatricopeptide repeat protein